MSSPAGRLLVKLYPASMLIWEPVHASVLLWPRKLLGHEKRRAVQQLTVSLKDRSQLRHHSGTGRAKADRAVQLPRT
eukprot:7317236-Pyramimonas_sp.AAC.1